MAASEGGEAWRYLDAPEAGPPQRHSTGQATNGKANKQGDAWREGQEARSPRPFSQLSQTPREVPISALWREARRALWQGRHGRAERFYLRLAQRLPEDPEVVGELGNLYTLLGDYRAAASAYAEAVRRLVRRGRAWEAGELLNTLERDGVVPLTPIHDALRDAYGYGEEAPGPSTRQDRP